MKGQVEGVERVSGGYKLIVEITDPIFGEGYEILSVVERREKLNSAEYKEYQKSLETIKNTIRLGEVEITYTDKRGV